MVFFFFISSVSTFRAKVKITKIPAKAGTNFQIKNIQPKYVYTVYMYM